ncbi:MAG: esterase-like activity of phytase family protein [Bauldia sp.]
MKAAKTVAVALAGILLASTAHAQVANLAYLGTYTQPTGLLLNGAEFGGISGLDFDPATGLFYAISDDRAERGPARFYTLRLTIDETGIHTLDIVSTVEIMGADGPFAAAGLDGESIRFDVARGTLFWSSERDADNVPGIFEVGTDGAFIGALAVPAYYLPAGDTVGTYGNLAFEGLTLSADGNMLFATTENALAQDGLRATLEGGSRSRLIAFDLATGAPTAEYVYLTDPIFTAATTEPAFNDNGISEILAVGDSEFLVVERSFASGVGNQISLYLATLDGATDILGAEIAPADAVPMEKSLLLTIAEGDFGVDVDNIESVTFGPEIGGKRTLIIASDNNFSAAQFTQFVAFTFE